MLSLITSSFLHHARHQPPYQPYHDDTINVILIKMIFKHIIIMNPQHHHEQPWVYLLYPTSHTCYTEHARSSRLALTTKGFVSLFRKDLQVKTSTHHALSTILYNEPEIKQNIISHTKKVYHSNTTLFLHIRPKRVYFPYRTIESRPKLRNY